MPKIQIKDILYIDDDEDMLLLIKSVLEQNPNQQVRTFVSPKLALTDIKENVPDLIILDYQIPEMNGAQIMKCIHDMELDVPIVFFTAQSAPEEIEKLKAMGAQKVIVKPIDINELQEKFLQI